MRRQVKPVCSFDNTLSHNKWACKPVSKLLSSVESQVACRQKDFGANLKLSMPLPSISILLLILLSLKKPFNCQLLYSFPVLYLVLRCLHRMHAIQAINRHPYALTKHKVSR